MKFRGATLRPYIRCMAEETIRLDMLTERPILVREHPAQGRHADGRTPGGEHLSPVSHRGRSRHARSRRPARLSSQYCKSTAICLQANRREEITLRKGQEIVVPGAGIE